MVCSLGFYHVGCEPEKRAVAIFRLREEPAFEQWLQNKAARGKDRTYMLNEDPEPLS